MNLDQSPAEARFRAEVREFFLRDYPKDILHKVANGQALTKADLMASERALDGRGWLAPGWPRECGGPGWTVTQRFIFDDELERAGAPNVVAMGLLYLAPIIIAFGDEAQKARWLPDILSGRTFWAQGYSEPEAGSDLASLRTRAERRGDNYLVNGEKIWTTQAHFADWMFALVRTSEGSRKQDGISFLCFDMKTSGVEVRPIITIDGAHHLNRVVLTDVVVPTENRIGEEGRGWAYARHLLAFERTSYAHVAAKRKQLDDLRGASAAAPWGDLLGDEAAGLRRRFAEAEIAVTALEFTTLRALAPLAAGQAPSEESSVIKIIATEAAQRVTELFLDLAGPYAPPFVRDRTRADWRKAIEGVPSFAPPAVADYFRARGQSIYGGANEVQKNIIARKLGLGGRVP